MLTISKARGVLLSGMIFIPLLFSYAQGPVKKGWLDLSTSNLEEPVALTGEWGYFEEQLLQPNEIPGINSRYTLFPEIWNRFRVGSHGGQGVVTYSLRILLPSQPDSLALDIPQLYSSYALWVNDNLVAANGKVAISPEETIPQWKPQTVVFANPGDTARIVLQVANFHHFNGGAKHAIFLGSTKTMLKNRSLAVISVLTETIVLLVLGILFLITFFFKEKKKMIMYFSLLCLTWAVRALFSNTYLIIHYFPDLDWSFMVRVEYLTLFLTVIWSILFLSKVFSKEDNKIVKYPLVGSNITFILIALLTSPLSFTRWLPVYLAFIGILLLYGVVVVIRALVNERLGAGYLTFSILLGLGVFTYDVFAFEGVFAYHPVVMSSGYIIIFLLMALVLAQHIEMVKSKPRHSNKLTYKDLYDDIR